MESDLDGKRVDIYLPDDTTRSVFIYDISTTRDICQMLSEWSSAPLQNFGLFIRTLPTDNLNLEPNANPNILDTNTSTSTNTNTLTPYPNNCQVLEDDRLLFPIVQSLQANERLLYKCRLLSPSLFTVPAKKSRLAGFLFHQARTLLLSGSDLFYSPSDLSKLCALNIAVNVEQSESLHERESFESHPHPHPHSSPQPTPQSPTHHQINLPSLISPQSLKFLSDEDWTKSILQELSDIAEFLISSASIYNITESERLYLIHQYTSLCFEHNNFGLELYKGQAGALRLLDRETHDVPVVSSFRKGRSSSTISCSPHASSSSSNASLLFDFEDHDPLLFGVNTKGIAIIGSNSNSVNPSPLIFNWDLFSLKCWSYSKRLFSWTELNTETVFSIETTLGYFISGLLMDYALSLVKGNDAPPCLKHQTITQLGWKGGVILDAGNLNLSNSLKVRENQNHPSNREGSDSDPTTVKQIALLRAPYPIRKTTNSITIAWESPHVDEKILRYEVRFGVRFAIGWNVAPAITNCCNPELNNRDGRDNPTCKITGLQKGKSYVFCVKSMNDRGFWSEWSTISEAIATKAAESADPRHLVILSHGICASDKQMAYLKDQLQMIPNNDFVVLSATSNSGLGLTRDGVNVGGHRLAVEIVRFIKRNPDLNKISLIGHNVGGLYLRYAAGALFTNDVFKMLMPVNFITLATPHFGCGGTILSDDVASLFLGETGEQLSLKDGDGAGDEPMLAKMCQRSFLQALLHFPNRMAYCNIVHDGRVDICSGSIRLENEYESVGEEALHKVTIRAFPNIIQSEDFVVDKTYGFLDSNPDDSYAKEGTLSPEKKGRRNSFSTLKLKLSPSQRMRKDMFSALSEVGWLRRDVVGYGHDQLIADPKWKLTLTGRNHRNVVVEHLCYNFLSSDAGVGVGVGIGAGVVTAINAATATTGREEKRDSFDDENGDEDFFVGPSKRSSNASTGAGAGTNDSGNDQAEVRTSLESAHARDSGELSRHQTTGLAFFQSKLRPVG